MSTQQPNFKQRIRLLDICAHEVEAHAGKLAASPQVQKRLQQVADLISDEAARMKLLNQKWEAENRSRQHKTAPKGAAITR